MARSKEFDPKKALNRAMHIFWRKGYSLTSLADLIEGMGIKRQSLYDTFGDKHKLFLQVLEHYNNTVMPRILVPLSSDNASLPEIEKVYNIFMTRVLTGRGPGACLLAFSAMELAHLDNDVQEKLQDYMAIIEAAFLNAVENGRAKAEINTGQTAISQARYLASAMYGLSVLARSGANQETIQDVIEVTIQHLKTHV